MIVDPDHPANAEVLKLLGEGWETGNEPFLDPRDVKDPYYGLGTHPDVVERLWDKLQPHLPRKCARVVYGHPALVQRVSGVVLA